MDFGDVIKSMRNGEGKKYAREGWNGKKMFIYLTEGRDIPSNDWVDRTGAQGLTSGEMVNHKVTILPHIDMMSAHGECVIGWLASQTDMLADDWMVVE